MPGSILEARVDNTHPLAYGWTERVDVCSSTRARRSGCCPSAAAKGLKAVAWFDGPSPLRSGWAWGQQYLDQAVEIVDAPVGKGRVVLFGPEIAWRGAAARHVQVAVQRDLFEQSVRNIGDYLKAEIV